MATPRETFTIKTRFGTPIGVGATVRGAIDLARRLKPKGNLVICGDYTSDGTFWGAGKGRVVAFRDGGRWILG